jgi:hypothetical protein
MQAPGIPSVDQLLVLLAVVEEGSCTGAARRLRRATSAISYAIDTLETQLGLPLLIVERHESRNLRMSGRRSSLKPRPSLTASTRCARVCEGFSKGSNEKCRWSSTQCIRATGW